MAPLVLALLGGGLALLASRAFALTPPTRRPDSSAASGKRIAFVEAAFRNLDEPYQWGGGHSPNTWGLDCSGLVIVSARAAGVPLPPHVVPTADGLWEGLEHVETPQIGDLAFYGTGAAQHVVIMTNWDGTTGGTIGANGGDRRVLTPEIAHARGAKVSFVDDYRKVRRDFLGFGKLIT